MPPRPQAAAAPRGPGRPKDLEKRAAIIAAARSLLIEHGVEIVRMEDVAVAAGVSKMTVYSHFQDKAALFAACVRSMCEEMLHEAAALNRAAGGQPDLESALVNFGLAYLRLILEPRLVAGSVVLIAALAKDPDLARIFHGAGPRKTREELARILQAAAARGQLSLDSPVAAAADLLSLWEGGLPQEIALGIMPQPDAAALAARVRRGTAVFLRAYRPG